MNTGTPEKRKRCKEYITQSDEMFRACCDSDYDSGNRSTSISMPEDLIDMPCGARTKSYSQALQTDSTLR